ncbi:hypothetical protein VPH35_135490 [Triticum aestivum]
MRVHTVLEELCGRESKTTDHLLFTCCRVAHVWCALGVDRGLHCGDIWEVPSPPLAPQKHWPAVRLLLERIWNHRHDVVFQSKRPAVSRAVAAAAGDLKLWSFRLKPETVETCQFGAHSSKTWTCDLPVVLLISFPA